MWRIVILWFVVWLGCLAGVMGQPVDSVAVGGELEPVEVMVYFSRQPLLGLTASAQTVGVRNLEAQQSTTLLPALNAVAGVRMEERSPGSYRMAMRGSLIRSPFGIRNVKIYMDEFPLTDAGGNTYLNLVDPGGVASVHVLKGPDGSLYGANSGGVVRFQPKGLEVEHNRGDLLLSGGSYGLMQEQLSVQRKVGSGYSFSVDQSLMRSDGYREHTALNKKTLQTAHKWRYGPGKEVRLLALASDLRYETPGGLTREQMEENRRMARPAGGPNPSAVAQKAGIDNLTFFGGVAHEARLGRGFTHLVSLFGSYTDFENPFITNYEYRKEKNLGLRTYLSYADGAAERWDWQMQLGFEGQRGWYRIDNYDNAGGVAADAQAMDDLGNVQGSFFYRAMVRWRDRLRLEASLGLNSAEVSYRQRYPVVAEPDGVIGFGAIWMPRVAASYLLGEGLSVRGSVSKGYSPPTLAEVRSSDNRINTELEAETGVNYEAGVRLERDNRRWIADVAVYRYNMRNGIVRHLRESGAEYYANAGVMRQTGAETSVWAYLLPERGGGFLRSLRMQSAVSYHHYRFGQYEAGGADFSGNRVTAVPDWVWSNVLFLTFAQDVGLNVSHNFTSRMPLNDANTVFADRFHLVQLKMTWEAKPRGLPRMQFFGGVDNLLNAFYSLGNDINAFGGRYFNPAAERNYYGGMRVKW